MIPEFMNIFILYKYTYVNVVMSLGQMNVRLLDRELVQVPNLSVSSKQTKAVIDGVKFLAGAHFGPALVLDLVNGWIVLSKIYLLLLSGLLLKCFKRHGTSGVHRNMHGPMQ